ncbi:ATP-dependent RNA helicase HrpA [Psychrosphaera sp. 1_MG-2023]|uniref:ATP-dependent RNA helicase HrpA n=1 Tax=Psychrosphaera sp. 1_MG-2023 TaxID=3062643 RepID=UPI0026E16DDB|nr:ATP-dependent RNA helicase HrpA [Psychrosphaera sp. 1_MG-2023]MDO6720101.1 ATP-dependent RNA helicase HrpA [Psychrosphaera sp. 1_MG-2023]
MVSEPVSLSHVLKQDYFRFKARLKKIKANANLDVQSKQLMTLENDINRSADLKKRKQENLARLKIDYPEQLPVSQKKEEIKKAICNNQVIIIAGETGSGKTTQIPKMCLELGRGIDGKIGHTQPRRLAARSVANRLCDELSCELGSAVGYKVRFNDQVSNESFIKLMTDGVMLAEMQSDRFLNQYDTIIIDEAHERSLNIDFILGYLRELLPKRPDLKVIITSATIDPESFSKHFFDAPIIEVSGRTYPVEVRYRPIDEIESDSDSAYQDNEQIMAIFAAVEELERESRGDILLFMNGEREIRDTAEALTRQNYRNTEVLPLYARLSAAEQNRIFASHSNRRIVLATNVAETSLTVPGIKYVVDTGTARISRYSYKTKVQRLPIEAISQASANQRKGRCGRTEAGICIRLYSEEDFLSRPEFTTPEILRTNLASVILQMLSLNLGDLEQFPLIERPDGRFINDGVRLLEELGAIANNAPTQAKRKRNQPKGKLKLTESGRMLSRIPVDPRLAKMVLAAGKSNILHEIIVIVAVLSIQDPRERPSDKQQKSDEFHARFKDKDSDYVAFLNLWDYLITSQQSLSRSQFRKMCKDEFLNYMRIREWQDLVYQIEQSVAEIGFKVKTKPEVEEAVSHDSELDDIPAVERDYQGIHTALLSGLLSHIGYKPPKDQQNKHKDKDSKKQGPVGFIGARNSEFHVFPGSHLFKTSARWIIAAELVETSRLFARYVAKIEPQWIEPLAMHVVNRSYSEPHWDEKQGAVLAYEKVTLYGLVIVPKRKVQYSKIDPVETRQIFIREALVYGKVGPKIDFIEHNQNIIDEIQRLENKSRRRDLLVEESEIHHFYDKSLGAEVVSRATLLKWLKKADVAKIKATVKDFLLSEETAPSLAAYPDFWRQGNLQLPIDYDFEPGQDYADGISVRIPLPLLNQIDDLAFDWHIAPHRHELIIALIKALPKQTRRNFVPAPNFADAVLQRISDKNITPDNRFLDVVAEALFRMTGTRINLDDWQNVRLPSHLKINFRVVDENDKVIEQGFDLGVLKSTLQGQIKHTIKQAVDTGIEQQNVEDWTFDNLPQSFVKKAGNYQVKAYPALVKAGKRINIELLENEVVAQTEHRRGVVELLIKTLPSPIKHLQQKLPNKSKLVLYFNPFGKIEQLIEDCIRATIDVELKDNVPRTKSQFDDFREMLRGDLNEKVLSVAQQVEQILLIGHRVSKQLKGKVSFDMIQSTSYIKAHLDSLIFKGFVSECGVERLPDIKRYVAALEKRMEKLKVDATKDRFNQIELDKVYDLYDKQIEKVQKGMPMPEKLREIYWMIEELRVSMFAQQLGTKFPISTKRIKQAVSEYISEL